MNSKKFLFIVALLNTLSLSPFHSQKGTTMLMNNESSITHSMQQFADFFTAKDFEGIGSLLTDNFSLFDPALKWVHGKKAMIQVLEKQFSQTNQVEYQVINAFSSGNTGILEFKITLDNLVLSGVDFFEFEDNKLKQLRCYYNQPTAACEKLQPFSIQAKSLEVGSLYQHYSGKKYKLISVARNSETLEEVVVYQAQYGEQDVWSRPLKMFIEDVVYQGQTVPRFKRIF